MPVRDSTIKAYQLSDITAITARCWFTVHSPVNRFTQWYFTNFLYVAIPPFTAAVGTHSYASKYTYKHDYWFSRYYYGFHITYVDCIPAKRSLLHRHSTCNVVKYQNPVYVHFSTGRTYVNGFVCSIVSQPILNTQDNYKLQVKTSNLKY